jgi:8-amino-7-oxononanoate synthase
LPPAVAAGVTAAQRMASGVVGDALRAEVRARAATVASRLRAVGLTVSEPDAAVVSVEAPGPETAVAWAADCLDRGAAVGCFRPPSTPDGRSRLRLTVNAGVSRRDFDRALSVIAECAP